MVQRIDALFAIERQINGQTADERKATRGQRSKPLIDEMEIWIRDQRAKLSRDHDLAKAFDYMLNRWESFTRSLDDGCICLSNNCAERSLRGVALGRKAWLFAGSDRGGQRAAAMYSLIVTAKMNRIDPQACLLTSLPGSPIIRQTESMNCFLGIGQYRDDTFTAGGLMAASLVRLKVTLDDVQPLVMRRVVVPFRIRFNRLHEVLQAAFGWTSSHLFRIRDAGFGLPDGGFDEPIDARKATLLSAIEDIGAKSFKYLYDCRQVETQSTQESLNLRSSANAYASSPGAK